MGDRTFDMVIVGGGLAGGLIALAIHRAHPQFKLALIEAGERIGGNHRWSWFATDLCVAGQALMAQFPSERWEGGYDVRFPGYSRTLHAPYRSLTSTEFANLLEAALPAGSILTGSTAQRIDATGVTLAGGERLSARCVIDCRSFTPSPHLTGGWQVFVGHHIRTAQPHGRDRPLVMDASVTQPGAYRFVYSLPLGPDAMFVEDTYYADSPKLDKALLDQRIADYLAANGWQGAVIEREAGVLPVITGGDFEAYRASLGDPGVVHAGARGGFTHPLTSYTLPFAVANAVAIAAVSDKSGAEVAACVAQRARRHWEKMRFYRALGRMMFDAAEPDQRVRVFARFYRLPEPLIERFYAGSSTATDKARVLSGRPPVPVPAAMRALLGKGRPLVHEGG